MARSSLLSSLSSFSLAAALLGSACAEPAPPPPPTPSRLRVTTTSFPADYLVARIGGDDVRRRNILPAGKDPPDFQPSPDVIASLADEELVVAAGAGYEAWMSTASLRRDTLVETSKDVRKIELAGEVTHSHGGGEHTHAGVDPHTWSDPAEYRVMARSVRDALVRADAQRRGEYLARFQALDQELRTLVRLLDEVRQRATPGVTLSANHPAYNYLMRRLGQSITSFHLDPESPPSVEESAKVAAWAASASGRKVMLWEAAPSPAVTAALPAGIEHVVLDPLEQPDAAGSYDYVARFKANVEVLRSAL